MERLDIIFEVIALILLITGIVFRKRPWGQRILFFALGMIFIFVIRRFLPLFFMTP